MDKISLPIVVLLGQGLLACPAGAACQDEYAVAADPVSDAHLQGRPSEVADDTVAMPGSPSAFIDALRIKAEQGDAKAQNKLGLIYDGYRGAMLRLEPELRGAPKDDVEAVKWYRRAAEQGLAEAQFNLGEKFSLGQGTGVGKDLTQAAAWYRRAAEQGSAIAQASIGYLYAEGDGVPKDDDKAVAWYRRSAYQGDENGQLLLAVMYSYGRAVPKDRACSYFWTLLSGSVGQELGEALVKRMSKKQIAEATRLAAAFVPRPEVPEMKQRYVYANRPSQVAVPTSLVTASKTYAPLDFLGIYLGEPLSISECPSWNVISVDPRRYDPVRGRPCFKHEQEADIGKPLAAAERPVIEVNRKIDGMLEIHGELVNGRLEGLTIDTNGVNHQIVQYEALVEKYGAPTIVRHEPVQNRMGATFDRIFAQWAFANLAVTFISMGSTIDFGMITVMTITGQAHEKARMDRERSERTRL